MLNKIPDEARLEYQEINKYWLNQLANFYDKWSINDVFQYLGPTKEQYFGNQKCCLCGDQAEYKIAEEPIGYIGHGLSQVVCKHCFGGIFIHGHDWLKQIIKEYKFEKTMRCEWED